MKTIADMTADVDAFAGLTSAQLELIAGCGRTEVIERGAYALRTGEPATTFYAIRSGRIALEIPAPAHPPLVIETLDAGDVLGWSWLFEPHRVRYDARAVEPVHAIAFDGVCLRGKCDADPELGYALMGRFAQIIIERLQATRMRLLDVYGPPSAEAV